MTLMPDISNILDRDNAISTQLRDVRGIPYRDKFDMHYDFDQSDILTTGNNIREVSEIVDTNVDIFLDRGLENIRQWVRKALNVEAGVYPIYTNDYGFEFYSIIGKGIPNEVLEVMLPEFLRKTLVYHPNIIRVENIESNFDSGNLFVNFDLVLDDENIINEDYLWFLA